MVDTSCII